MLGRFTTLDPIRDSHNWYVYVNNDPANFIDPLGLLPEISGNGIALEPGDPIQEAIENNLGEPYVVGDNDCDQWVQDVLEEAGSDITDEWGRADWNTVSDHVDNLGDEVQPDPEEEWNVFFQNDNHAGLLNVDDDGVTAAHQGYNSSDQSVESRQYEYDSVEEFEENWGGTFEYYPLDD